jgi:recombinational DNA repair protein RecR
LHALEIPLDAVNIDIDPTDESFQHASLQELILATSRTSDAEAVARIVFSVLPSVDQVSPGFKRRTRGCIEVQRHLESFKRSACKS